MKIALLGYGRAGKIHFENLLNSNVELRYVLDIKNNKEIEKYYTKDINVILNDNEIKAVLICTPTNKHYSYIKLCLKNNKHVFCEKPISHNQDEIKECFELAEKNGKILFCAFNRRFDPNLINIKNKLDNFEIGNIQHILSISRDFPYPTKEYLEISSGIFHDCVVHDIDFINWFLKDKPISLYCTGNKTQPIDRSADNLDNVIVILEYSSGIIATINCSRIAQSYDQRVEIQGDQGMLFSKNFSKDHPISFPERYAESYIKELDYFIEIIKSNEKSCITLQDCLNNFIIAESCQKSYDTSSKVSIKYSQDFRNYDNVAKAIKRTYYLARKNQTFNFVQKMHNKYLKFDVKTNVMDIFKKLQKFVDISDPDISLPNYHHGIQTAEKIREDGHPEWLQLIGLIHDLGKIMYLKGSDEEGTSIKEQWAIVGDTFITGCKIPDGIVFPEFNKENPDMQDPKYNTKYGIYTPNCGLDNVYCSWGHDEYLYQILKYNKCNLPYEALYIIRFHSLYSYHKNNEYQHLTNDKDKKMLSWLNLFNKYDLYTKSDKIIIDSEIENYYNKLINKFMNNGEIWI